MTKKELIISRDLASLGSIAAGQVISKYLAAMIVGLRTQSSSTMGLEEMVAGCFAALSEDTLFFARGLERRKIKEATCVACNKVFEYGEEEVVAPATCIWCSKGVSLRG